jgi:hypothetical protein
VAPEPLDELGGLFVRPHLGRPPAKGPEGFSRALRGVGKAPDVADHFVAVWPVAFDRDKGEALLADQALAYTGAPSVVLGGAVRGLPEEHAPGVTDALQERVKVTCVTYRVQPLMEAPSELRGGLQSLGLLLFLYPVASVVFLDILLHSTPGYSMGAALLPVLLLCGVEGLLVDLLGVLGVSWAIVVRLMVLLSLYLSAQPNSPLH